MPSINVRRDDESAAFFDATARDQLLIKTCPNCRAPSAPRTQQCRRCGSPLSWLAATGDAILLTWSATPPARDGAGGDSTLFGYVELAEGPWLESLLVGMTPEDLTEGMPLRVTFLNRDSDEERIPAFRPR